MRYCWEAQSKKPSSQRNRLISEWPKYTELHALAYADSHVLFI